MMSTFYLIRHASNDYFRNTLVGRKPGIHLNETGRCESQELAEHLAGKSIQRILSSPLERCRETAEPIAQKLGLQPTFSDALLEVDFGDWTGKTFAELDTHEQWRQWNSFRSGARAPNGETMLEVQARMVGLITRLRFETPDQRIALVSHCDPLRATMIYFLGAPLDFIRRIEISPASISILEISDWGARFDCLNMRFYKGEILF